MVSPFKIGGTRMTRNGKDWSGRAVDWSLWSAILTFKRKCASFVDTSTRNYTISRSVLQSLDYVRPCVILWSSLLRYAKLPLARNNMVSSEKWCIWWTTEVYSEIKNSDLNVLVSLELVSTNIGEGNRSIFHREALLITLPHIIYANIYYEEVTYYHFYWGTVTTNLSKVCYSVDPIHRLNLAIYKAMIPWKLSTVRSSFWDLTSEYYNPQVD